MKDTSLKYDAENYRLLQAAALIRLYSRGKLDSLDDFCNDGTIDPFKVLSKEQIRATLRDRN